MYLLLFQVALLKNNDLSSPSAVTETDLKQSKENDQEEALNKILNLEEQLKFSRFKNNHDTDLNTELSGVIVHENINNNTGRLVKV